jgi:hypothetical protein
MSAQPAKSEKPNQNIRPARGNSPSWSSEEPLDSISELFCYVDTQANKAIDWYWVHKRWKARLSRAIQASAIVFTALGGLSPIVVQIARQYGLLTNFDAGLGASVLVGMAAAVIGLDRAFGFSSGWARYVLTATAIRKALEELRMDWTILMARATPRPSVEHVEAFVQRAREFSSLVEGLVLQETKDWITEFQSNLSQMEKETRAQLDTLKSEAERNAAAQAAANKPGSIELNVTNADKTDSFTFNVLLESAQGEVARNKVSNGSEWVRLDVLPGQYAITISATADGKPVNRKSVAAVKPDQPFKLEVTLPI